MKLKQKYIITKEGLTPINPRLQPISQKELDQDKLEFVRKAQSRLKTDWHQTYLECNYEVFDPESKQQEGFLESGVVEAYAINFCVESAVQVGDEPHLRKFDIEELKLYREMMMDEVFGFNVELPNGTVLRKRHSTSQFRGNVAKMQRTLEQVEEIGFTQHGYVFPDPEEYKKDPDAYNQILFRKIKAKFYDGTELPDKKGVLSSEKTKRKKGSGKSK